MSQRHNSIQIELPDKAVAKFFALKDKHLKLFERLFGVTIHARGSQVKIHGNRAQIEIVSRIFSQLSDLILSGYPLTSTEVEQSARIMMDNPEISLVEFFSGNSVEASVKSFVQPRSVRQKEYLEAVKDHDIVVAIGPAGTGKTYLAVGMACAYLAGKRVRKIILTRPAVEAGEKLGFLPGDLSAKIDPYLRPLYDALHDMLGYERVTHYIEKNVIEVAPLGFMRGRTLNEAFIILDEAQNSTSDQMKMFLTRMGFSSKVVITGDVTQVDLPPDKRSGLKEARWILDRIDGIKILELDERDVVRHPLVQEIIAAYERAEDDTKE